MEAGSSLGSVSGTGISVGVGGGSTVSQSLVPVGVAVGSAAGSGSSGSVDGSISTTYCWIDWRESNLNWGSQRLAIASSTKVKVSGG